MLLDEVTAATVADGLAIVATVAFAFDEDAAGFVFRSAMNLERQGSLKK